MARQALAGLPSPYFTTAVQPRSRRGSERNGTVRRAQCRYCTAEYSTLPNGTVLYSRCTAGVGTSVYDPGTVRYWSALLLQADSPVTLHRQGQAHLALSAPCSMTVLVVVGPALVVGTASGLYIIIYISARVYTAGYCLTGLLLITGYSSRRPQYRGSVKPGLSRPVFTTSLY